MSGFAGTQRDAGSAWISSYPFEIKNGGLGVRLSAATSSDSAELVGNGQTLLLTNLGDVDVYVAWGDDSVVATTAHFPVFAGTQASPVTIPEGEVATHIAVITASGSSVLVAHLGRGN